MAVETGAALVFDRAAATGTLFVPKNVKVKAACIRHAPTFPLCKLDIGMHVLKLSHKQALYP